MALHDYTGTKRSNNTVGSVDNLAVDSRRVNQNTELITRNETVFQVTSNATPNGSTASLSVTFTNVQNDGPGLGFIEYAVYVGSVDMANMIFPYHNQSTVNLANWQVIGPAKMLIGDDVNFAVPTKTTTSYAATTEDRNKLTFYNVSAGTVTLTYVVRIKYIFNRS